MKKAILVLLVFSQLLISNSTFAFENFDNAKNAFMMIQQIIINKRSITTEVVDYSVKLIKNWPNTDFAVAVIETYQRSPVNRFTILSIDPNVLIKNSKWYNQYLNTKISELDMAEAIIYASMLYRPDVFINFNCCFSEQEINSTEDFIKNKSIKILEYIENNSNNENYKKLAFLALLDYYFSKQDGINHIKLFFNKHPKSPIIAKIRLNYANKLKFKNLFIEATNEFKEIINQYNDLLFLGTKTTYGIICYNALSELYYANKDYINSKKYLILLKNAASLDNSELNEINNRLKLIEKLIKK